MTGEMYLSYLMESLAAQMPLGLWNSMTDNQIVVIGTPAIVWASRAASNPASMIWYLLYPFRGTTEPPVLDSKHPLRSAFTRHGQHAARHPVISLLISVAAAAILIYPFPFLYTNNYTNGASNLPHHVWTSAQPFEGNPSTQADVAMRSIWVHGNYMEALDPKVLLNALEIQNELLGPTLNFDPRRAHAVLSSDEFSTDLSTEVRDSMHASNGLGEMAWFFHSPLQYWSGSEQAIAADPDIIKTVNEGARRSTSVNVTLRHSIVFSGKRFEDRRLVAADALVITLIHKLDSPVGRQWERRAEQIAHRQSPGWRLYPSDGRSLASTLYEFRFKPLSFQDDIFLAIAYSLMVIYFAISLSRLRALKSRLGLMLAVATQIAVSIMSSFTVCAIFKIDISKIPREAFPVVVLTCGLENIFRLINAVIMTPLDRPTAVRMADALGNTGHIALAGVSQNLVILWLLSKVVTPGVAAFCTFAAIALLFDFFYLLTFFVAVLSVDVRRTELSDTLGRAAARSDQREQQEANHRKSMISSFIRGDAPISTRVAGTAVMIGFVLIAQWHFFDNESFYETGVRLTQMVKSEPQNFSSSPGAMLSIDLNQARTPTAWLKMQDHETAHEVIRVIKPNAHSYIARVYEPLVFVLNGADRRVTKSKRGLFLPAVYDFAKHQSAPFLATVIFAVAAVSLLMNYLLWDENPEEDDDERPDDAPLISIKTFGRGHALDIVLLVGSTEGVFATVGLDRLIRLWNLRKGAGNYCINDYDTEIDPFPILALTIDKDSNWLAILSAHDKVFLWNIPEKRWGPSMQVELKGRKPMAFFFGNHPTELIDPVIVLRSNGLMTEMHMEYNECTELQICRTPLICGRQHIEKSPHGHQPPPRILTNSKRGCIHVASRVDGAWTSTHVDLPSQELETTITSILPLPILSSFLVVRGDAVDLVDISTYKVTNTFQTEPIARDSLRCFHSARRRPQCGSVGLGSLALVYTSAITGDCVLHVFYPYKEGGTICFRDINTPGSKTCCRWPETIEVRYSMPNPGDWYVIPTGYVVGLRKIVPKSAAKAPSANSGLRRRGAQSSQRFTTERAPDDLDDSWEVWSLSSRGERTCMPLCSQPSEMSPDHLFVSELGPVSPVGQSSIAIGLGNAVKIVTVGTERYESTDFENTNASLVGMTAASRRKKPAVARKKVA